MDERTGISRRSLLRGAALLAAAVIPIRVAYAQKASKADSKYQDSPKDGQQCSTCVYFQAPDKCGVVDGAVKPQGWCAMYNKK